MVPSCLIYGIGTNFRYEVNKPSSLNALMLCIAFFEDGRFS